MTKKAQQKFQKGAIYKKKIEIIYTYHFSSRFCDCWVKKKKVISNTQKINKQLMKKDDRFWE